MKDPLDLILTDSGTSWTMAASDAACALQRAFCFVRARQGDAAALTTCRRSSGFCADPIEKNALNHFLPGTPVLSLGTKLL